jgi:hypothetical protein
MRCLARVLAAGAFLFLGFVNIPLVALNWPAAIQALRPIEIKFALPVVPAELERCFSFVVSERLNRTRGDSAIVVTLSALEAHNTALAPAVATTLYSIIEGGAGHVILVPGTTHTQWTEAAVAQVRNAIAAAVDHHGEALPTSFSAVPPAAVECLGVGHSAAGIAWAAVAGATSVFHAEVLSELGPVSLRFSTASARFLPQIYADGFAEPPLAPVRKHFQACGGARGPCDPLPDALRVSSSPLLRCLVFFISTIRCQTPHHNHRHHHPPQPLTPLLPFSRPSSALGGSVLYSSTACATLRQTTHSGATPPSRPTALATPRTTAATACWRRSQR